MRVRVTNQPKTWSDALRVYGRQLIYLILFIIGLVCFLAIITFIAEH